MKHSILEKMLTTEIDMIQLNCSKDI